MGRLTYTLTLPFLLLLTLSAFGAGPERVVDLSAPDGAKLKGTFFGSSKPGPGVLLLHQCNRQRKVWDELARQLSAAGVNVLTFDLRGFGESDGKPAAQATPAEQQAAVAKWPGDVDVAFQYLISQPGVKKDLIGVGGASCGVNNSIQAARRHPEVKSMVLLSGPTGLEGRKFLRESQIPALFGVADDDEFVPSIVQTQWLYAISTASGKKLVHYEKGGHGADIFKVHPEFQKTITDWFVQTLIKTPGSAPAQKDAPPLPKEIQALNLVDEPGGPAKVSQMLAEARQKDPKANLFPEDVVNFAGYEHLQANDVKGAIEIMKLNAEAYPDSANVYDSLSDAYLADGQKELARTNAKKALEMLPNDKSIQDDQRRNGIKDSAEQKLKQLGE